jgi:hypothetical protein
LLPLPAILVIADAIIACKIHDLVSRVCVPPAGVMFGAQKGTQVLDIAHAVQLHLQKGADNFGEAGLAQGDIATYYDSINCLKIARWIEEHEESHGKLWASCFLRLQLLPPIQLTAGDACTFLVAGRSLGALTGSRSAVAAGRIPVETVACDVAYKWKSSGVQVGASSVTFASWVDNYYAFGSDLTAAIRIAEIFEEALNSRWNLQIKASSRSVISPCPDDLHYDNCKWPRLSCADVLGHLISEDTSAWPCWKRTKQHMWAAFWKNCVGQQTRSLSIQQRCKMLNRCVLPILHFRNTRWPWTHSLAEAQQKLQRKMLAHFLHVERWPEEPFEVFNQRRYRIAGQFARQCGDWGNGHAERVCTWADHLQRPRNSQSLAAMLFSWHTPDWLQDRRDDPAIGGHARPGTRASSGPVCARWDESLAKARRIANASLT